VATLSPACQVKEVSPIELRVMTHDSFAISEEAVAAFEKTNQVKVLFIPSGDTGSALNKAILSVNNPIADVFYGLDNTFLSRALDEGIFVPYIPARFNEIPDSFKLDSQNRALPVDYGDVCLNYDRNYFASQGLKPPDNLDDLLLPDYKSLLAVQNPATSSPGLAFLLATIGKYGEEGYLDFWRGLVENDVLVVNDWESAYYTEFSGSSGKGPRPIVVSYNSSPVFELIYATTEMAEPPTVAIVSDQSCFRQIEFVGILKGTKNRSLAEKWIDYMLSPEYQAELPMQMFVMPVHPAAQLQLVFVQHLLTPSMPAFVSPKSIAENRERWIQAWRDIVLR
jgi:thiamine transport system substrate-binding protein